MSRRAKALSREMHILARQAGGSFKTIADRVKIAERVAAELAGLNIQIRSVEQLKSRHIEMYIHARREQNISLRSCQNEMSAIRAIFRVAGRHKLADPKHERLSNEALGFQVPAGLAPVPRYRTSAFTKRSLGLSLMIRGWH